MKRFRCILVISLVIVASLILSGFSTSASAREVNVEFVVAIAGTSAYTLAMASADIVNKKSSWLKISTVEASSDLERITVADRLPPERRKNVIFGLSATGSAHSKAGLKPYPKKFSDLKIIGVQQVIWLGWLTYNKDLKTYKDFEGKKLGGWPRAMSLGVFCNRLIDKAWGLGDKVKLSAHRPTGFKDALMTKIIDAAFVTGTKWGDTWAPSSYNVAIMGARQPYFVDISKEAIDEVNKGQPVKLGHGVIPKDAFEPGKPMAPFGVMLWSALFHCFDSADDEVVYEFLKVQDENKDLFGNYMKILKKGQKGGKFLADSPMMTKETVHPGAWKYYKEKGYVQ